MNVKRIFTGFIILICLNLSVSANSVTDSIDGLGLVYQKRKFDFWINYFTERSQERFQRQMNNGAKYYHLVKSIFKSHGLPEDLFYVGLIESGYHSKIKSSAGAEGHWQFMKSTAKETGLRVDGLVDERHNIVKSTHAAAKYFKDLFNIFGDWELALCSYNAGPYKIIRAIQKGNTRDYRELVHKKLIPKETMFYVPKIAAAREIFENPKEFGLRELNFSDSFDKLKKVKIYRSFDLNNLARNANIDTETILKYNPDIKARWVKVSRKNPFSLYLPQEYENAMKKIGRIMDSKTTFENFTQQTDMNWRGIKFHKVIEGENLGLLAKKYNVSVTSILDLNRLRRPKIYPGQLIRIERSSIQIPYTVKRGDDLNKIAAKFKTQIRKIQTMNKLKTTNIYVGQKIYVPNNI
ncbi:MAG: LysM peptidoglycan-binding domain-containing protein [Halobacteriovoraceae bacterium]|nr:LysM peptidoglycan-binding domain-containing protein [Halobacteriovoraceae bacterium]